MSRMPTDPGGPRSGAGASAVRPQVPTGPRRGTRCREHRVKEGGRRTWLRGLAATVALLWATCAREAAPEDLSSRPGPGSAGTPRAPPARRCPALSAFGEERVWTELRWEGKRVGR